MHTQKKVITPINYISIRFNFLTLAHDVHSSGIHFHSSLSLSNDVKLGLEVDGKKKERWLSLSHSSCSYSHSFFFFHFFFLCEKSRKFSLTTKKWDLKKNVINFRVPWKKNKKSYNLYFFYMIRIHVLSGNEAGGREIFGWMMMMEN